jgi:hypothetical protein
MRRTILVGAVTPIAALVVLAWTQAVLRAQTPKAPTPAATPAPLQPALVPFGSDGSGPITVVPQAQPSAHSATFEPLDANPVRQRFLELSKKKAQALNEEELKREVESMETEVRELEAWVKVQQAVRQLHEVVDKHPNTRAADTANKAIQLIEERRSSPRFMRGAPQKEKDEKFKREDEEPGFGRGAQVIPQRRAGESAPQVSQFEQSYPRGTPQPEVVPRRERRPEVRPPQASDPQLSPTS